MIYPQDTLPLNLLFALSLNHIWHSFLKIFWLIILFVLIITGFYYLPATHRVLHYFFGVLVSLIGIFLYVAALLRIDALLRQQNLTYAQTLELSGKKILKIFAVFILFLVCAALWFFFNRWLIFSLLKLSGPVAGILATITIGIPLILLIIYFYLAIPILALYSKSVWQALYKSAHYAHTHFLAMLALYAEAILILFIISSDTRHGEWLLKHHLLTLVDLITFGVLIPMLIVQTLLILNNARLREEKAAISARRGKV